ncbi:MAG: CdaR family protein, partial [Candidatus Limnocylindrales bacterium]
MTRVLRVIVHNWPLKLAAVALASLLYGGLVLSQSTATHRGVIPVELRPRPEDVFLLTTIPPVTEVRYFSASRTNPIDQTFEAWVDLSAVAAGPGPVTVPIRVRSVDERINVIGYSPEVVTVQLDTIESKEVPVVVDHDPPPEGLQIGLTSVAPESVTVSGPASALQRVTSARANVVIQAGGIGVDQDVPLLAVDSLGDAVNQLNLEPRSAHVVIPVFSDLRSKTLTVSPVIVGTPAPGFEVAAVRVEPLAVTVEGDPEQLAPLARVDTAPVTVNGASSEFTIEAELSMPSAVVPVDVSTVQVTIEVRPVTATRSFEVGLRVINATPDAVYTPSADRVLITVGGSTAELDRLSGASLVADLDVANLTASASEVP